ncbi:unnamed protein product [Symbiodinium natans]|uniref:Uncharacterized protein n=1 Tax=Symbiodinium natans TaxID=878477 RepID=A0A812G9S8_9DINO|nr:unnamed protein product [Symbiodinium natans]
MSAQSASAVRGSATGPLMNGRGHQSSVAPSYGAASEAGSTSGVGLDAGSSLPQDTRMASGCRSGNDLQQGSIPGSGGGGTATPLEVVNDLRAATDGGEAPDTGLPPGAGNNSSELPEGPLESARRAVGQIWQAVQVAAGHPAMASRPPMNEGGESGEVETYLSAGWDGSRDDSRRLCFLGLGVLEEKLEGVPAFPSVAAQGMQPLEHVPGVPAFPSVAAQGMQPLEHVPGVPGASGFAFPSIAAQGMQPLEHVPGVPGPGAAFPSVAARGTKPLEQVPGAAVSPIQDANARSPEVTNLLQGLQAVLRGSEGSPTSAEQVKYHWQELPKLPEIGAEASLAFMDWLHLCAPCVEDMSSTSADYWACLCKEAERWYAGYISADPVTRSKLLWGSSADCILCMPLVESRNESRGFSSFNLLCKHHRRTKPLKSSGSGSVGYCELKPWEEPLLIQ